MSPAPFSVYDPFMRTLVAEGNQDFDLVFSGSTLPGMDPLDVPKAYGGRLSVRVLLPLAFLPLHDQSCDA